MAVALAAAITLAFAAQWWSSAHGAPYRVVVRRGDEVLATYDLPALEAFDQTKVEILGKTEEGPSLTTVLKDAGVERFDSIRVIGPGVRDDGEAVLSSKEVTPGVLLDVSNRGTVKLVGPAMAWSDRVRDVTDIIVDGGSR